MTNIQQKTIDNIVSACSALGFYRFENKSSYHDDDAVRNLDGKTHYVDPDTMRFFNAKTLRAKHLNSLFYIIEQSQASDCGNSSRVRRVSVFNIFGECVEQEGDFTSANYSKTAYKNLCAKYSDPRFAIRESKKALDAKRTTMRRNLKASATYA